MKKLRLNLDQLTVDSFDTAAAVVQRGTVRGEEQCTCPTACNTNCTCPGCPTCDYTACGQESCNGSCFASCNGSCYFTECGGDTVYDHTCNATVGSPGECCPY
jgi:hypothetical protein